MISFDKKFLFIHMPKSGGTSVRNLLKKYEERDFFDRYHSEFFDELEEKNWKTLDKCQNFKQNLSQDIQEKWGALPCNNYLHMAFNQYKMLIDDEIFKDLFKFGVARNPFDRLISMHLFDNDNEFNRDIFVKSILAGVSHLFNGFNLMMFWFNELIHTDGTVTNAEAASYLRFEDGFQDRKVKDLCHYLDIDFEPIRHLNKNIFDGRKHYSHYYDSDLIKLVETYYSADLNAFNYSFDKDVKHYPAKAITKL